MRPRVLGTSVALVAALAVACTDAVLEDTPTIPDPPAPAAIEPAPEVSPPAEVAAKPDESASPPELAVPDGHPPTLDRSIASVDLADVVFDTFRGGFIPLSEASDEVIEQLRDTIKPVYVAKYAPAAGGEWLRDSDLIVGYSSESGALAYPVKMLNLHEIVHDVVDGVALLVTYCPLCGSGIVYDREIDGTTHVFGNTSALYESDLVMFDHETGSYWFQTLGEAIVGTLTGKRLKLLPSRTTTWGQWKELHPNTKVLRRNLGLLPGGPEVYEGASFAGYRDRVNAGRFAFPVSEEKLDPRLKPADWVLAAEVDGLHKAYWLSELGDMVVNDVVGGREVVVVMRAEGPTGSAFFSQAEGESLTFKLVNGLIVDDQTGSLWDDAGRSVGGPLAKNELEAVPSRTAYWFALAGALPGIELHAP